MIGKIIETCIHNKVFVILATTVVIGAGVISMLTLPVDALPDLSDVQVIIFASYEGQAPQVVRIRSPIR
jgi:Cu(I)/Ag(I) efflux system membrane protein CusA/SilA